MHEVETVFHFMAHDEETGQFLRYISVKSASEQDARKSVFTDNPRVQLTLTKVEKIEMRKTDIMFECRDVADRASEIAELARNCDNLLLLRRKICELADIPVSMYVTASNRDSADQRDFGKI